MYMVIIRKTRAPLLHFHRIRLNYLRSVEHQALVASSQANQAVIVKVCAMKGALRVLRVNPRAAVSESLRWEGQPDRTPQLVCQFAGKLHCTSAPWPLPIGLEVILSQDDNL